MSAILLSQSNSSSLWVVPLVISVLDQFFAYISLFFSCCFFFFFAVRMYRFFINCHPIITHLWMDWPIRWREWVGYWTKAIWNLTWGYCLKHLFIKSAIAFVLRAFFSVVVSPPGSLFFLRGNIQEEGVIFSFLKIMNYIIHIEE